jgi:UDP-GlcNAc:undecaprenyl-phosphate GlcNAc-1-phosphate transferase
MDWSMAVAFAVPLVLSWILVAAYIQLAPRWGLVDLPSERKIHLKPTPTGAGLALYLAVATFAGFWSLFRREELAANVQILLAGLIVAFGLLDDRRPLPWQLRLVLQVLIAVVAVKYALPEYPVLKYPPPKHSVLMQAIAVLWIVVSINAFNFMDNMDGLCTGVAGIIGACLVVALLPGRSFSAPSERLGITQFHLLMVLGALAGFFWFNRPPARVFMGDAGSTFLGFIMGVACLPLIFSGHAYYQISSNWVVAACMMVLPIYDLASVLFLRLCRRRGLFVSDRNNLSHRLVASGWSSRGAVILIWFLCLVSGVGGLLILLETNP